MRRAPTLVVAGTLALAGLTGGLVVAPAVATAATSEQGVAEAAGDRVERIKRALQGLVDDGTLTAEQQQKVADRLAEQLPPHGRGRALGHLHGGRALLPTAAEVLGMTPGDLRAELREGRSLAQVAGEKGVAVQALVDALVADAQERMDRAVQQGRLTQEQADARKAELAERMRAAVEREGLPHGGPKPGRGPQDEPNS